MSGAAIAQLDVTEILQKMEDMELIVQNRQMKNNAIALAKKAGNAPDGLIQSDYDSLKYHYSELARRYNKLYLAKLKTDLSKFATIKLMANDPEAFASRYFTNYKLVVDYYNGPYQRNVTRLMDSNKDPVTIVTLGIEIVKQIVHLIKNRKEAKGEIVETLLTLLNEGLFSELEMPAWDALRIPGPTGQGDPNRMTLNTIVPPSATTSAMGSVTLLSTPGGTNAAAMPLKAGNSSEVTAPKLSGREQIIGSPATMNLDAAVYEVDGKYANRTAYRIEVKCSGLVYAFAWNNGRSAYAFYPYQGPIDQIPYGTSFNNKKAQSKQMIIGESESDSPTDRAIVIPNATQSIIIQDPVGMATPDAEWLVILVSKSELDMHELFAKVERADPALTISERLTAIYGDQLASDTEAEVKFESGSLLFELNEDDQNVLPLVIKIPRK